MAKLICVTFIFFLFPLNKGLKFSLEIPGLEYSFPSGTQICLFSRMDWSQMLIVSLNTIQTFGFCFNFWNFAFRDGIQIGYIWSINLYSSKTPMRRLQCKRALPFCIQGDVNRIFRFKEVFFKQEALMRGIQCPSLRVCLPSTHVLSRKNAGIYLVVNVVFL